jgi:glycosyltransferase involved in cell wall biosynthesis
MSVAKPSLLVVSHTYVVLEHHKKLIALAAHFEVTCLTFSSSQFSSFYGLKGSAFGGEASNAYQHIELPMHGKMTTKYVLRGLGNWVRRRHWDVILVENEPWSLVKWQTLFWARLSRARCYGEFTWENVLRTGLRGVILDVVYRLSARWADFFICGNMAAGKIMRDYGMEAERVLVSPQLGVDLTNHCYASESQRLALRAERVLPTEGIIVGFAGRIVAEKGVPELVAAVEALQSEEPISPHLALLGHGSLSAELEVKAQTAPWLHLLPGVPHPQVPLFLQTLDLLVLGSHPQHGPAEFWEEQFGHILIEAIGSGAVVVGSRSGAIPEVIGDDEMLFEPGDQTAIEAFINRACTDPQWLTEKRAKQLQRVREHYTHERVASDWAAFLKGRMKVA